MKAILEFNLPEDQSEFELASKAGKMHSALWDIAQEVFRPARKHGYSNVQVQGVLDKANESVVVTGDEFKYETGTGDELIHQLEKLFYQILEERNIDLR